LRQSGVLVWEKRPLGTERTVKNHTIMVYGAFIANSYGEGTKVAEAQEGVRDRDHTG
jgi:hypothetical protein